MNKKGQAALEFLTTYGWAIMMILVIVGAFSYLGFTNPQTFIQDKCLVKSGFNCLEVGWVQNNSAAQEKYLVVFMQNLLENDISITANGTFYGDCRPLSANAKPIFAKTVSPANYKSLVVGDKIPRKEKHLLLFSCPNVKVGELYKIEFEMPYREIRTTLDQKLNGEIVAKGSDKFTRYLIT